jgi:hypothetical protein
VDARIELAQRPAAGLEPAVVVSRTAVLSQEPVIFVDGITRAGKSMLGPILSTFEGIELERMEESIEHVACLYRMGKLSRDAAIAAVRLQADRYLYESLIGRNTNFRFTDHSGVWRSSHPWRYLRRLWMNDGPAVVARLRAEHPAFQNMTHDQLANFELHDEAFGERLRMLEMIRHPVDLADSWLRRGFGTNRYGQDPLVFSFCIRYEGQDLPYYVAGWEEAYLRASPADRVIRMIAKVWDDNQTAYARLRPEQQQRILFIPFEEFIRRPLPYLRVVERRLARRMTRATLMTLRRQRRPHPIDPVRVRRERRARLEQGASPQGLTILDRLASEYEALAGQVRAADAD